jgi:hypothetical protein
MLFFLSVRLKKEMKGPQDLARAGRFHRLQLVRARDREIRAQQLCCVVWRLLPSALVECIRSKPSHRPAFESVLVLGTDEVSRLGTWVRGIV